MVSLSAQAERNYEKKTERRSQATETDNTYPGTQQYILGERVSHVLGVRVSHVLGVRVRHVLGVRVSRVHGVRDCHVLGGRKTDKYPEYVNSEMQISQKKEKKSLQWGEKKKKTFSSSVRWRPGRQARLKAKRIETQLNSWDLRAAV